MMYLLLNEFCNLPYGFVLRKRTVFCLLESQTFIISLNRTILAVLKRFELSLEK